MSLSEVLPGKEKRKWLRMYAQVMSGDPFHTPYVMDPENNPLYLEISAMPLKEGQQVVGISFVAKDVTQLKKYAQTLQALNQELNTFMYKTSHDLRGPLATIHGTGKYSPVRGRIGTSASLPGLHPPIALRGWIKPCLLSPAW